MARNNSSIGQYDLFKDLNASSSFDLYAELEKLKVDRRQKLINEEMNTYSATFGRLYERRGPRRVNDLRLTSTRPAGSLSLVSTQVDLKNLKKYEQIWKRASDVESIEDNWVFSTRPLDANTLFVAIPDSRSEESVASLDQALMTMETSETSSRGSYVLLDDSKNDDELLLADNLLDIADAEYLHRGYHPDQLDFVLSCLQLVPNNVEMVTPNREDELAIRGNHFECDEFAGVNLLFARRTVEQLLAERTSTVLPEASHRHDYVHKVVMRLFMIQRFAPAPLPKRENTRSRCCSFCYNFVLTTCRKMGVRAPSKDDFGPWSTHEIVVRQNNEKFTQCQFLRCQVCPHCKMSGTKAHTMSHCPENPNRRRNSLMIDGDESDDISGMGRTVFVLKPRSRSSHI
ncbi:unnamed protein product [Caenorhabditis bovis]|uniref:Nanos-type domain-containing protein n=1 Tax=Caenorhabditis bovis TaxID=2654633 RepID=A0A8S1ECW6_9PELO|nr:unnamed protein product [Caenorhabditis bovis]